jgi:hypothetical protein
MRALTYREFAKVCRAYRTLDDERHGPEQLQHLLADRLVSQHQELGRQIVNLSAAEFQTLLVALVRASCTEAGT